MKLRLALASLAVLPALAALGCGSAARARAPTSTLPRGEAPPPSEGPAVVALAREAPVMPACAASDPVAVAALTPGVPAAPSIARNAGGGVVAFVTNADGDARAELSVLALDAGGAPAGQPARVHSAEGLAAPVVVASGAGYVLAWRQGAGAQSRVAYRRLDARGAAEGDVTTLPVTGWLGAPAALDADGRVWLAVARSERAPADPEDLRATHVDVVAPDGAVRSVAAPEGGAFDALPPVLVRAPGGVRAFATVFRRDGPPDAERAVVRLLDGPDAPPALVARDLDHPAALATPSGVLLAWRARVARRDAAVRAVLLPAEGEPTAPPVTLATLRGAYDARVALAPVGDAVGAFTLSALADDAGGSLNASLVAPDGTYVGRAPLLTSFLVRSPDAAVAARDRDVWVAADGRDVDGSGPELILARVACDPARPAERLDLPPGTMVQSVAAPDAPPATLERPGGAALQCQVRATGALARHLSGAEDALAGSTAAVVALPRGAALFAVVKPAQGATARLAVATLDARGRMAPMRYALDRAGDLLAAEGVAGGALAAVTYPDRGATRLDLVGVRPGAVTHGRVARGLRNPGSAAIVPETGAALVVGEDDAGDTALFLVPWAAGRAGAAVVVARLRPGDAVLDVVREGRETLALLARPDRLGGEVAQSLAVAVVPDGAAAPAARDPFADPLGHPGGHAQWARRANGLGVVYAERGVLRLADYDRGELRNPRSLLGTHPGGGALRSSAWAGARRWLALSTGLPEAAQASARALTVAVLGEDGAVRGVTSALPDDASAVAEGAALGAAGDHVVVLYARTEAERAATWTYVDATCTAGGGR